MRDWDPVRCSSWPVRRVLSRWLYPWRCLLCHAPGMDGLDLCRDCAAQLPRNRHFCQRCAEPLPTSTNCCGRCQRHPPPWDRAWAPFRYAWPLDRLVSRYKFSANLAAGRTLTTLWQVEQIPLERPELIVVVPLHPSRMRQRGYNQALELARSLAKPLAIPCRHDILTRVIATTAQTKLDAMARRRNVRHAFRVRPGSVLPTHVAILDDVMTTGATLDACTRALKHAGIKRVDVWALARAPCVRR